MDKNSCHINQAYVVCVCLCVYMYIHVQMNSHVTHNKISSASVLMAAVLVQNAHDPLSAP